MTKDEAWEMIDSAIDHSYSEKDVMKIKEALAQPAPVQEPVAWMRPSEWGYDSAFRDHSTVVACTSNPWTGWVPLYTAPKRPWVDLTPAQYEEIWRMDFNNRDLMDRTIAKLKELNT